MSVGDMTASLANKAPYHQPDPVCEDCEGTRLVSAHELVYKAADGTLWDWPKGAPLPTVDCPKCGGKP